MLVLLLVKTKNEQLIFFFFKSDVWSSEFNFEFVLILSHDLKAAFEFYLDFWEPFYFRSLEHI